ncbi:hypothetical protein CBS101457_006931 [Exobasidium rhododendri]|nr:hypothetical protein CBS101457_006931 [Exobasidium rhododendri]
MQDLEGSPTSSRRLTVESSKSEPQPGTAVRDRVQREVIPYHQSDGDTAPVGQAGHTVGYFPSGARSSLLR